MTIELRPLILMPEDLNECWSRVNHWELYPALVMKVNSALQSLLRQGIRFYITQAYRSYQKQNRLYAKGRTAPGGIVTNARGGRSVHNFWGAVDGVFDTGFDKPGLQPDWTKANYRPWAEACRAQGLEAGFYWKNFVDAPHVQLPLRSKGLNVRKLRRAFNKNGKAGVFALLDRYEW